MPDVTPKCSEILNIAFQVTPDFLRKLAGLGTLLTAPWDASAILSGPTVFISAWAFEADGCDNLMLWRWRSVSANCPTMEAGISRHN